MPFLCLRHDDPDTEIALTPGRSAFDGQTPAWRPVVPANGIELWCQEPYGLWDGSVIGAGFWLLCDGFIARPYEFDALSGSGSLHSLGEAALRHGAEVLEDLEGQYAVCVIDARTRRLVAARDRLGGAGLYYHHSPGVAAVATSSRYLQPLRAGAARENPGFIAGIFAMREQHAPGETPFLDVDEVLPGARVELGESRAASIRPPFEAAVQEQPATPCDWIDAFREVFRRAVRDALGGCGGAAVMLSGGMDSVPVLAVAAGERGADAVSAVSWFLRDHPDSDESGWIETAAGAAGVALHAFDGAECLPFSNLDRNAISADSPHYNPVRGLLLRCYRGAAEASRPLVLPGTQGDMIYPNRCAVVDDLIGRGDWRGLWSQARDMYRRLGVPGMYRDPALRYPVSRRLRYFRDRRQHAPRWMTSDAADCLRHCEDWPPEAVRFAHPDHAWQVLGPAMTFTTARENEFSRRFGVERRDPYQNQALVGLMLRMPVVMSHMNGQSKFVMRGAMRGVVPDSIRLKSRTGLLNAFINAGYRSHRERIREFLLDQDADTWARYVRPDFVRRALRSTEPAPHELATLSNCIGYSLWRDYWNARG